MKTYDVTVEFVSGGKTWAVTYPKIHRITEGPCALRLETNKYPSLAYRTETYDWEHVISVPYTAMLGWTEKLVSSD